MDKPYYQDNHDTLYCLDFRKNDLPDECVQMVCTSPPYWGLRKYSGEQDLIWGGDENCRHEWLSKEHKDTRGIEGSNLTGRIPYKEGEARINYTEGFCSLCGAWKGAYGLEPMPEMYVQHTIEILREIRRVLRKDGVVFWNIGDSYAGSWGNSGSRGGGQRQQVQERIERRAWDNNIERPASSYKHPTIKPKDLCLIPFRVAIAAQEDGWWVRSVIIWSKPNPMPESVTDRPTESHEYLLMLTQSGKSLYWTYRDGGGSREKPKADYRWVNQLSQEEVAIEPPDWKVKIKCPDCEATGIISVYLGLDVWQDKKCPTCNGKKETQLWKRINLWRGHDYYWDADAVREEYTEPLNRWGGNDVRNTSHKWIDSYEQGGDNAGIGAFGKTSMLRAGAVTRPNEAGRNIRTVWEFPTGPYPEAHFAVFPEKLPELCIKAATPEVGCCSKCGAPWERIVETTRSNESYWGKQGLSPEDVKGVGKYGNATASDGDRKRAGSDIRLGPTVRVRTIGWRPTCKCKTIKPPVPSIVLDPFTGAGTTLWVAKKLGRKATGYELSEEYCQLAIKRNQQQAFSVTY